MTADAIKTILVVDDEPDIVTYITSMLEDNGYKTLSAGNGEQAMAKIRESRPDLICLDISMPEKSGVGLYRDLRESDEYKDMPVIVVTGLSQDFEKFIKTRRQVPPPTDYVAKPIDKDEFLEKIQKALA
jgi:CheY-like chemotaxis protein